MRKLLRIGTRCAPAVLALAGGTAVACETPSMVEIPDGETATMEEMVAAQEAVQGYVASMEDYLACVDEELEAAGEDAPDEYKSLMISRHNNAVSEMEAVAEAFNQQIQAFREANPDE